MTSSELPWKARPHGEWNGGIRDALDLVRRPGSRTAIWFGPMRLTYRLPDLAKARPVACGERRRGRVERELVDELRGRRHPDGRPGGPARSAPPAEASSGDRDREVEPLTGRIDPATERPAGEPEEAGQPRIGEPDRRGPVRADPPDPWLVVRHVEVAGLVEDEVVPHRLHPVASKPRVELGHLREDLAVRPDGLPGSRRRIRPFMSATYSLWFGPVLPSRARPNRPMSEFCGRVDDGGADQRRPRRRR